MVRFGASALRVLFVALGGACAYAAASDSPGALQVIASEPRAYGWRVGDVIAREVRVDAPSGWTLVRDSVPRPGGRGHAIEVRSVQESSSGTAGGTRHRFALEYQVFLAPPNLRTLEIPALRLRFESGARSDEVLVEAWPVVVAPLAERDVSPRRGLGELQPDRAPPLLDTEGHIVRLALGAMLAALAAAWLAIARFGPPWRAARNRPFARAWRTLRGLPERPSRVEWREACRVLHEALNRSAGAVVFEPGLERFIADQPSFHALRDDLARFMQASREEFFGASMTPAAPSDPLRDSPQGAWLVELARRCHEAERSPR